ncbi:phosphatase PAP2 family protein [Kitasatospora sp. NPDC058115]|uniref:phosphatase PAP2 family protein n=1 Tax=Kitasatospora sp. NPDC058115 TaxID=3346347 RepID=UPI0036D8D667
MAQGRTPPSARGGGCVLAALLAALVAFSRLYRGMHHPADVLAGPVNGGAALWIMWRAFLADRGRGAGATGPVRPPAGRAFGAWRRESGLRTARLRQGPEAELGAKDGLRPRPAGDPQL